MRLIASQFLHKVTNKRGGEGHVGELFFNPLDCPRYKDYLHLKL